ncbi:MAG: error-prone DNA polymerase, partial [Paracoccaceae bacterium]
MFVELSATSNFTFLTGASHPEEYMARAALLGLPALAIADENSVAGIVRAHSEVRKINRLVAEASKAERFGPPKPAHLPTPPSAQILNVPRLIPAALLHFEEGISLTALPQTRQGWASLCRLLSKGRLRARKGACHLRVADLLDLGKELQLLLHPPQAVTSKRGAGDWMPQARRLTRRFGQNTHLLMAPSYDGQDTIRFEQIAKLGQSLNLPLIASARPIMHQARRRRLADVLTAIRTSKRVDQLGRAALANAEQRLRSEAEMQTLFHAYPEAVERTGVLADCLQFSLDELRYEYPSEISQNETPTARLRRLAQAGLRWRYPHGTSEKVTQMLEHELTLIAKLKYEPYFLTVHDIVHFARSRDILCQGRGSAANSVVCYCLGVTSVSPEIGTMVFERFVSEARDEPPDIDVDFEHERREEVIQHIYE